MTIACVSDFRARAKRRLPKFVFDYLDGGAGSEEGVRRNERAFDELIFKPRALVNIEERDLSTQFFGRRWAAPFGTAPIGLANMIWPAAEEAISRAAANAGIPFTLSTAGTTTIERIAEIAGPNAWFQLYVGRSEEAVADLIDRTERAGYDVLLVTVDVPTAARRLRDIRNSFAVPFRFTPRVLLELVRHPAWLQGTIANGPPRFVNFEKYVLSTDRTSMAAFMSAQIRGHLDWDALKKLRDRWPRRFVVKGLLTAEDAVRARDLGCDGVVISNHGGRQLAGLPAPIDVLADIRRAVGPAFPLIIDSGIRSGEHIIKALAAGADFALVGRATMYAVAAQGPSGAQAAIDMLLDEASRCLAQIGHTDIPGLKAAVPLMRRP